MKLRDTYSPGYVLLGVDLPRIHPFEVITAITDGFPCAENCYFLGYGVNDRNPELSGGATRASRVMACGYVTSREVTCSID
jgi:hypothetical protein